ncbi:MAG: glycosyltransferase family 2 protein [Bacteroidaceae bacterium]|nr:glycosyltransferase family 2 protein [Bacteroidaceae bacterium]
MISIIIPTYNYNCVSLVTDLAAQGDALVARYGVDQFDYEIIVAEDGSTDALLIEDNSRITAIPKARHICRKENVGRARIRNFLVSQARLSHVLIIDSDAVVFTPDYLSTYWEMRHVADVVCGSIQSPTVCPYGCELRYKYEEAARDVRQMAYREAHPYAHLSTFNILFHRYVFDQTQFDERCTEYGYEDALMGLMLEKLGLTVEHIDNPLIHDGMDPNAVYLQKVETALRTLHHLGEPMHSASPLVRLVRRIKRWHITPLCRLAYRLTRPLLYRQLMSHNPSMTCLKCYKLGYYLMLDKK